MIKRNQMVGQATFARVVRRYFTEVIMRRFQLCEDQGKIFQ